MKENTTLPSASEQIKDNMIRNEVEAAALTGYVDIYRALIPTWE